MPIIDLHCHSTASDGLLAPHELALRAVGNGVEMLALTDHDDLSGLAEAGALARENGLRFVDGVEISIEWGGQQVHILGYGFRTDDPTLNAGLAQIRSGRVERAQRMSEALARVGIAGAFEGAMRYAKNPSLISRAHFARYLVECGRCRDVHAVFEDFLVPGRPGYVDHRWATLEDSIGWIRGAGGIASIAHPGRYKFSRGEMRRLIGEFKEIGGQSIEIVSGRHSNDTMLVFARLAQEFGLLGSCGSDFHGPEESYTDLGRIEAMPDGVTPIWEAF